MGDKLYSHGQVPSVRDMTHTQVEVHDNVLLLDVFSIKYLLKST